MKPFPRFIRSMPGSLSETYTRSITAALFSASCNSPFSFLLDILISGNVSMICYYLKYRASMQMAQTRNVKTAWNRGDPVEWLNFTFKLRILAVFNGMFHALSCVVPHPHLQTVS